MSFNSIEYLIFLPIVLLLYYLLPKKFKWIGLLIASYVFYLYFNIALIFLIVGTTLISYLAGILIDKYRENAKIKKACLIVTLIVCIGTLFVFKYLNFSLEIVWSIANWFGAETDKIVVNLVLPVGISFYTFQTLSYVIDVYRGNLHSEKHLGYYALFVVYFPQLVAGPIERPENLLPQLKNPQKYPTASDIGDGLRIMAVGFAKKIVIADGVCSIVENVYGNAATSGGLAICIATLLFAIQIYCDFSGYTDIAIGTARLMGIKLTKNFDRPYLATSIADFWRRWHITLSTWFRDYVYIPLGGSRCKFWKWAINIMIVFLLSGLWHGASLTFVIWGALHGLYQVIEKGYKTLKKNYFPNFMSKANPTVMTWINRSKTFILVCFAWIFFRANSIDDAWTIIKNLFSNWNLGFADTIKAIGLNGNLIIEFILFVPILVLFEYPRHFDVMDNKNEKNADSRFAYYLFIVLLIAFTFFMMKMNGTESAFIYFQF